MDFIDRVRWAGVAAALTLLAAQHRRRRHLGRGGRRPGSRRHPAPAFFSTSGGYATTTGEGGRSDLFACDFALDLETECGGSAPLVTTFDAAAYGIAGNLTALEFESRKIEE